MLICKDGSVHLENNLVFDRTTNAKKFYKVKPPMFRGYINETGLGTLDSVKDLADEEGHRFRVSLLFEDWVLNEIVLLPVLDKSSLTQKEVELRRRAMSEQILKSLFGIPRKTTDSWTEYTFDTFSASTWVSWNPIDPYSGGGICILYC